MKILFAGEPAEILPNNTPSEVTTSTVDPAAANRFPFSLIFNPSTTLVSGMYTVRLLVSVRGYMTSKAKTPRNSVDVSHGVVATYRVRLSGEKAMPLGQVMVWSATEMAPVAMS